MTIAAHLEEAAEAGARQRDARRTLRLKTTGAIAAGNVTEVSIHNISATGLLIETRAELAEGERIAIDLPLAGECWATVVWRSDRFFGCQFAQLLTQATLSAVELRSEAGQSPGESAGPDASFGQRLQRLRINRGLTLAHVARHLSVSKPTVWAWEHGKARPVDSRVSALAELLGVTRDELVQDPRAPDFGGLIARSREQIASVYGIPPARVKIWIEL